MIIYHKAVRDEGLIAMQSSGCLIYHHYGKSARSAPFSQIHAFIALSHARWNNDRVRSLCSGTHGTLKQRVSSCEVQVCNLGPLGESYLE